MDPAADCGAPITTTFRPTNNEKTVNQVYNETTEWEWITSRDSEAASKARAW